MAQYCIGVHVVSWYPIFIRQKAIALMEDAGFLSVANDSLADVAADHRKLPPGESWYGMICSGSTAGGWVSVYVEDWKDSGVIAQRLSESLIAPVLEIWVADDAHWGYAYFEDGHVKDRFANNPALVGSDPAETAALTGSAVALESILKAPAADVQAILDQSRGEPDQLPAAPIAQFTKAVGLNFEHVYTSFEQFFDDDPEDYSPAMERWAQFRFYAFHHPARKTGLAD